MDIVLANPRGFCAGVDRAIEIVNRAIEIFGAPIYVKHEVVHNKFVVDGLREKGAIFIEDLNEVPEHSTLIFSAHGVSQQVRHEAKERHLKVFDATCPLVTKVHMEVARHSRRNEECVLIGHKGHPEVEGTMGQYDNSEAGIYLVEDEQDVAELQVRNPDALFYVTQTTLSVDDTQRLVNALKGKFPNIQGPKKDDICYATQNRQDAVKQLAAECDLILVVGAQNSSNSSRLQELAENQGCRSYLINNATEIDAGWLEGVKKVGVTAGASAPEILVQDVIKYLESQGGSTALESEGVEENIVFVLPAELRAE
ncbi:4-hydroxy-3-methylbut-2-enyl diphosphate reductase [Kangiella profundi]|uniref:4-hydroxy-3-methylbut-2-enyl diphosphate reductase n=1 Tax=Kangiella profundi TaxID=1561924 RepID=A0A2K9AHZ2_9GAMM|nr:4-hydroxy-3-methylbut-2-enyl diphosphate reductase [Kangiella profundi]AUD78564.1 4-hydroxy-3-methylbut-2-enyl diphosphate reductase [Kangiella profundi]GGF08968.1 4-hydroxy-3-methylbut-2-enyl diphosphate reductase [Kangiella profundi]